MVKASDHEASVKERSEELKALAAAKKVIEDKTGGASSRAYNLLQVSSRSDDISEVARMIRHLGRQQKDFSLGLLSTQISSAAQTSQGADVFAKVKGLIEKMIQRLLDDAKAEAGHKAYCDKEMAETEAKKAEHEEDLEHLDSKIKKGEASKAKLTADIAELEAELGQLAQSQKEMDSQRSAEHAAYLEAKTDYEQGVEGVQMAIKVLKEYYGGSSFVQQPEVSTHSAAGGESSGIIGLLEVAESDFSKLLAETEADEKDSQDSYDGQTKANKISKAEKETSAKYKTKELKDTEAELAELGGDKSSEQSELDAVLDYYSSIKKQCVAKPDSYEERKSRREAEINGLKDALDILENQGVGFLSVKASRHHQ
jgi:chromosome segregation ATPase